MVEEAAQDTERRVGNTLRGEQPLFSLPDSFDSPAPSSRRSRGGDAAASAA